MNLHDLEDRLHHLADQLEAPATTAARQAIGRRAGVLRRRRRKRNAVVGGGVLALALVAGVSSLARHEGPDAETSPAAQVGDYAAAPALTVDGWEVTYAVEMPPEDAGRVMLRDGSLQVFRRPDQLSGPAVYLVHQASADLQVVDPDAQPIDIGGTSGFVSQPGSNRVSLHWGSPLGDSVVQLHAWKVSLEEVLAFAEGLQPKDSDIAYPPSPDDQFGFVATVLPQGVEEHPIQPAPEEAPVRRFVTSEQGAAMVSIETANGGEAGFEWSLADGLAASAVLPEFEVEEVTVGGRPALLAFAPTTTTWYLVWRPTDGTTAMATLSSVDRSGVDVIIAGIREMAVEEWQSARQTYDEMPVESLDGFAPPPVDDPQAIAVLEAAKAQAQAEAEAPERAQPAG